MKNRTIARITWTCMDCWQVTKVRLSLNDQTTWHHPRTTPAPDPLVQSILNHVHLKHCPICGNYGLLDDCVCHANAKPNTTYIATYGMWSDERNNALLNEVRDA